jgi:threonine synthase
MNYFSTRDKSLKFSFKDIFLRGLAPGWRVIFTIRNKVYNKTELKNLSKLSYEDLAQKFYLIFVLMILKR